DANPGALIVRVHRSNFALVGFTEMPTVGELAALARERKTVLVHDLGSGALDPALGELTAAQSLREGAHLVLISGDKLLGGPGAGVAIEHDPASLVAALRAGEPPVVALVRDGRVVLDVRCVTQLPELAQAVAEASVRAAAQKGARLEGEMPALASRGQDDPLETEV